MKRRVLVTLTISVVIFSLVSFGVQTYLLWQVSGPPSVFQTTGRASSSSSGQVQFCINQQPAVTFPCNTTLSQNTTFSCQLDLSDPDGDTTTVTRSFVTPDEIFNVTPAGLINFTPTNDDVGNHTVIFEVDDNRSCTNSLNTTTVSLSVANINDPPFLVKDIPDQTFQTNTTLSAFFLTDYFDDPDGDELNFSSTDPDGITVTILSSSEVRFTSNTCVPDGELVVFTATDPFNASADSNAVTVTVTCPSASSTGSGDDDDDSGGGGGGGGGCIPKWECQEWFACLPSGEQWRRCYDTAACASDRYLTRLCEYGGPPPECEEDWLCSDWSNCYLNGTQVRECEDLNACGTAAVKPATVQECVYIPTCNDGIQNGDEEGVDCGGSCAACPLVEKPSVVDEGLLPWWLIMLIILGILLTGGVVRYYQGEIAKAVARLGFFMRRETYKEVLLDKEQRNRLFERIRRFESRIAADDPDDVYEDLGMLVREYVHEALGLPVETIREEVADRCSELGLQEETTLVITQLFEKLDVVEREELIFDEQFVQFTAEEVRTLVCLTSEYELPEVERPIEELVPSEDMSFYDEIFVRMTNALRAVQFEQHDEARKEYVKLLEIYEPLSDEERDQVYPELKWSFTSVRLASEVSGVRHVKA